MVRPPPRASAGVGVHEIEAALDRSGFWEVTVEADLAGEEPVTATGAFQVFEDCPPGGRGGPGDHRPSEGRRLGYVRGNRSARGTSSPGATNVVKAPSRCSLV